MPAEPKKKEPGTAARATRFPVEMPIRFRKPGEKGWRAGTTENVSRSGVLFRSDGAIGRDSELQMEFTLPKEALGRAGAEVECRGKVARLEENLGRPGEFRLAAMILGYRFIRSGQS